METIHIETTVNAPSKDVWDAYTGTEHITQWNFASDDWCCPRAENNVSVGGKLNWRMEAKDGSMGFDFTGEYFEVEVEKKLAFAMDDGRKVVTTFEEVEGGVKVSTDFEAEDVNSMDMQRQGWQAILENFKKYAESR